MQKEKNSNGSKHFDFEGQILAPFDSLVTSYGKWQFFVKTCFFVRFSEVDATIIYDACALSDKLHFLTFPACF